MTSFTRPPATPPPSPPFVPVNKRPIKGITAGGHAGLPLPQWCNYLNGFGEPVIIRFPCASALEAGNLLTYLEGWPNLLALLLIEDISEPPSFTVDAYNCYGVQFGNECDLAPYYWTPQHFAEQVMLYYQTWKSAGFTHACVSGGIFSVDAPERDGTLHCVAYLTPLLQQAPADLIIDVHWYNQATLTAQGTLQQLTVGHSVSCSEYGMPSRTTSEDLAACDYYTQKEIDNTAFGFAFTCAYQAGSGPRSSDLDNFGLFRYQDQSLKPWGDIVFHP